MSTHVKLNDNLKLRVTSDVDILLQLCSPFIEMVAQNVEDGGTLNDSVLNGINKFPAASNYFVIDKEHIDETFCLKESYLYQEWKYSNLGFFLPNKQFHLAISKMSNETLVDFKDFLSKLACGEYTKSEIVKTSLQNEIFDYLEKEKYIVSKTRARGFLPNMSPGVHRLQHASLLYRSKNAGVLVDPHLNSAYDPGIKGNITRNDLEGMVDCIIISHFHEDHWSLSTLILFPFDILIIVPKVPASSIICGDMAAILKGLGFTNVIAVDWYADPIIVKDIQIHVLPFYGEQPLRYEELAFTGVRNWGNTYVIETQEYKSWFLIDSGADALGSMEEVAQYVRNKIGKIDFLLSNLKRFEIVNHQYINGGLNWLTLSSRQIQLFPTMKGHCLTLGPERVSKICELVNSSYFLPYAHWWGNIGTIPEGETEIVSELVVELDKIHSGTKVVHWSIGDGFIFAENNFELNDIK